MSFKCPEFKFVTEGCLQEWKASNSNFKLPEPVAMIRFLYELCWAMIRGELPLQKCKLALDSATFSDGKKEEIGSMLVDIIAHLGQDLTMSVEHRNRLTKMAKWFAESSLLPYRLLQERCEEEFLWESELSKLKANDLKSKEVRINTRLLYQQTKFNLLREESEGYSKLVTLLCQNGVDTANQSTSFGIISIIKSLIGHFDLDPNRVFDIVLECFELYHDNNIFYSLIPIFPKSHAAQILGFKFQYYQRIEVSSPVPSGLYRLAALLVKSDFIDLDSICVHLLPKDEEAFEHYDALIAKRFEEANKIGKINLAATGKDLMEDEKQDVTVDLFTALDMESEAVMEHAAEVENNQSFGLLIGFLSIDDWYHAQILFDRLSHLNPVAHILVCEGLFRAIEKRISSSYDIVCQTRLPNIGNSFTTCSDITESVITPSIPIPAVDLSRDLFQMLTAAGPYLHRDTILLQKVCRVLRAYYLFAQESAGNLFSHVSGDANRKHPGFPAKEARLRVEEALGVCLLPSLQLIPANPAVGQEIWEVLSLLPYEARYRLYGEWEKDDERNPMVLAARQIAKLDTRRILKRLAKENLKQLGRMVAKLAHSNPMTVLRTIVHQIEAYKDMITPVVDAFKYLTQLEYDILEYVVIERLAQGGREKLKDDGLNLSDWLQSLASFWGHLCKKYPSMELRGLFQYLVNQLKKGLGIELVLLQELIQQMANVQYTENMTEEQLDAMAGSETLRFQATLFGMARNNKALNKSTMRLRDSLLPKEEPKLAIPLLLLIAQHRSMVVIHADAPYIKMVSEQFDRCHGTLLQYVEFLLSAVTPTSTYAQLIPPLNDLVHKYHLEPEVAFLIFRPILRLFKYTTSPEVFWPVDAMEETLVASEENDIEQSSTDIVLDLGTSKKPIMWSDLLEVVRSMLPVKAWNSLSPDLYATFWGLTLYDLYVPRNRYEAEITKQHAAIKALEELSDNSNMAITKRKKDKERIQELLDRLASEFQKHEQHVASVRHRLRREKDKWLSSCPDTLKINMEFLQRCIFPRCIFSMPDAVYCAKFVHMLHSLGTPFFNTVNHIDVLICKTLQPMIFCCTEYEAGRLGRFLYETLKMAYYWKSDESIYERECGNMPGFAVYYRYPNSQRVAFGQFVRVHWKWSGRMTRLLAQCLESSEYMEIRNALIILTKISTVFPVTRKSGVNLEKRVVKIKGDEREDLKVLATGVAAALAARKSSWVSEEEFGMGYLDLKLAASSAKPLTINLGSLPSGPTTIVSQNQNEMNDSRNSLTVNLSVDHTGREQIVSVRSAEGRSERPENSASMKSDLAQQRQRVNLSTNGLPSQSTLSSSHQSSISVKAPGNLKNTEELNRVSTVEPESKSQFKRSAQNSLGKQMKQEVVKEDVKSGKSIGRAANQASASSDRDSAHPSEGRQSGIAITAAANNGNLNQSSGKVPASAARTDLHSVLPRMETGAIKPSDSSTEISESSRSVSVRTLHSPLPDDSSSKQKRTITAEEQDRITKRRKGDSEGKDDHVLDSRLLDKAHLLDNERNNADEQYQSRSTEKLLEKLKEKGSERFDKDHKEKLDRSDMNRGEDIHDKSRDKSMERHSRERSSERMLERVADRCLDKPLDKTKDDKGKPRHNDLSADKSDERFHGQNLPPPPPLPLSFVPQSVGGNRRDEEADRKSGTSRHIQRLSPMHDDKDRRHSEENVSQDDMKRRREDDFRDRKREERDGISLKADERDREKGNSFKDDLDPTAAKRRKFKRDHLSESGVDYSTVMTSPSSLALGIPQSFDVRERNDRKGGMVQHRAAYAEEQLPRLHGKEAAGKTNRRELDQLLEREWEEEKRQRTEAKRKHRK